MRETERERRKLGDRSREVLGLALVDMSARHLTNVPIQLPLWPAFANQMSLDEFPKLQACLSNNKDP